MVLQEACSQECISRKLALESQEVNNKKLYNTQYEHLFYEILISPFSVRPTQGS